MDKKDKKKLIELLKEVKETCKNMMSEDCYYCDEKDICKMLKQAEAPEDWEFPNNKRWRAEKGGNYWYVDGCGVGLETTDGHYAGDDYHYYSHNYFRTKKEAEEYTKVLKTEMLLREFADEHNYKLCDWNDNDEPKYHISFKYDDYRIAICVDYLSRDAKTIYFNSLEIARQAIEEIGKDRLVEYLTYE